jgi:hypothetical protein
MRIEMAKSRLKEWLRENNKPLKQRLVVHEKRMVVRQLAIEKEM